MPEHWNDDEMIRRLYGLGAEDEHLKACPSCAGHWQALLETRRQALDSSQVSEELLAAQRRAIYARLEAPQGMRRWLPLAPAAAAAAAVVLLAVLLRGPAPRANSGLSDSDLFSDVYVLAQSIEPQAVEPIHDLFEVDQ